MMVLDTFKISQSFLGAILIFTSLSYAEETNVMQGIEGDYDHNISVEKEIVEITSNISEDNITIYQNGKKIENISEYQMSKIYQGDLNGDGFDELVLKTFSGGAHCCFDMPIIQLKPSMPKSYSYKLSNTEFVTFKDLDGDNKLEIITWDDRYSYFSSLCFACSPNVKIVANFNGERLVLRPKLIEKFYKPNIVILHKINVGVDKLGGLEWNSHYAPDIMEAILYNFYIGQTKEAIAIMQTYFNFEHPAVRKIFLTELVDAMARSPFFDQLREINNWFHNVSCYTRGCKPSIEFYEKYEVVWNMFQMYDSHYKDKIRVGL